MPWHASGAQATSTADGRRKDKEKLPLQQRVLNGVLNVSNVPYRCALCMHITQQSHCTIPACSPISLCPAQLLCAVSHYPSTPSGRHCQTGDRTDSSAYITGQHGMRTCTSALHTPGSCLAFSEGLAIAMRESAPDRHSDTRCVSCHRFVIQTPLARCSSTPFSCSMWY